MHTLLSASGSLYRAHRGLEPPSRCALPGAHEKGDPGFPGPPSVVPTKETRKEPEGRSDPGGVKSAAYFMPVRGICW
jgi:hypothetical protein